MRMVLYCLYKDSFQKIKCKELQYIPLLTVSQYIESYTLYHDTYCLILANTQPDWLSELKT